MIRTMILAGLVVMATSCGSGVKEKETLTDTMLYVSEQRVDSVEFLKMELNREAAYVTLADSVLPSIGDSLIALCVEAAFTGELLEEFSSSNIAGDYVIDGVLHKGYKCGDINGFMYADRKDCTILPDKYLPEWLEKARNNGGMLFQQMLLVIDGRNVYRDFPIKPEKADIYRAACVMKDGSFAVIQSKNDIALGDFIAALIKMGVSDALYLDMGRGWNYGWYRVTERAQPVELFDYRTPYQTNWLVVRHK